MIANAVKGNDTHTPRIGRWRIRQQVGNGAAA
jgi:hypothetical protein